jgi:TolB-like protein
MVARGAALKLIQTSISELWGRSPGGGARVLEEALNHLEPGITIFDAELQLVSANRRFIELRHIPEELGQIGATFEALVRFRAERGDYGAGDVDDIVTDHVELARRFESHCVERVSADGTVLEIRGNPLPGGGFIAVYTDITTRKMAEQELAFNVSQFELAKEKIDPRIAADGGRIAKTSGDGILVEFASAVDVVRNALDIQGAMRRRNADVSEARKIEFRVGINIGDVIVEGDDIHGDGVNVAARLEALCGPGEVYVSGAVYDQAEGKVAAVFDDLGEHTVKNIAEPVRAFGVSLTRGPSTAARQAPDTALPLPDKPSIAVLPFDNISNDPEQEYFVDGLTEDLITDLSKMSGLFVIARNSSFAYKGKQTDVRTLGRELGVRHVLEGSVRRAGDRIRINAQLIDTVSGGHLWAERYDGNLSDIFDLQDEIGDKIVSALQVELSDKELSAKDSAYTPAWEAYDHFIRGRQIAHEGYFG